MSTETVTKTHTTGLVFGVFGLLFVVNAIVALIALS